MTDVLAIIPARSGSKGIPNKNSRLLNGHESPTQLALTCALAVTRHVVVSSDAPLQFKQEWDWREFQPFLRPPELAQDDTPMIAVVQHALKQIPGPPDQIILLVQPTQPLRKPAHLRLAVQLLQESGMESVVSVIATNPPAKTLRISGNGLWPYDFETFTERRQDSDPAYKCEGTVYAFRRLDGYFRFGYGCLPMLIDPTDTCPLDTESDWREAERRLQERG